MVGILKSNNYDIVNGEPSVFEKELLAAQKAKLAKMKEANRMMFVPQTGKQVAGRCDAHCHEIDD